MLRIDTTSPAIAYSPYRRCDALSGPMNRCEWMCRSWRSPRHSEITGRVDCTRDSPYLV